MMSMRRLSLYLLGPYQVTLDGEPITEFRSDKVRALLAYLAVEADGPHQILEDELVILVLRIGSRGEVYR